MDGTGRKAAFSSTATSGEIRVDGKIPFNQLCQLFERMTKAKNNSIRKQEFLKFAMKWKEIAKKLEATTSFYPVLRLILPQADKERLSYGVKEVLLAKLYIEVLGLSKTGQDAKKLLEYRNPKNNLPSTGDFAEVAFQHVLSKRCITKGDLTILQINQSLDDIARYNNEKKREMMKKTLLDVIKNTSAIEQKWLIRIMLKDTKLRLGQKAILLAFHPDAEEVYNVTTSLKQVCERLPDVNVRLSDTEIELFQPFRPMLALNAKLEEVEKLMDCEPFSIEIKYDGERSQLHKDGNKYKYFSRSGKEYSTVFGETPYIGTLTPHIHGCFRDHVTSCIIDGEMMGFDPAAKIFMQKGGQFDIKHVTEDSELQPCLVVFDILYLNGKRLSTTPQSERVRLLQETLEPLSGRLQFVETKQARSNQEVVDSLNEAIDRREEGIIVKNPSSVYAPNKRKGSGWFKLKPEYTAGVVDDLDLIIVGGSFGTGRRGNFLSMFHLGVGVRSPNNPSLPPQRYKSLTRVGSGYTDKQLLQIIEKLKPHLKVYDKKNPPDWLEVAKEKPEVYLHPRNSVVVQVRASEILPSSSYATGCTLRFPRLVGIRDDKEYTDAMDEDQLKDLRDLSDGKLAARHATLNKADQPVAKRRKLKAEPPSTISSKFQGADVSSVQLISTSFEGKTFCIITGSLHHDKQELERRIVANGGSFVQNAVAGVHCVIARNEHNIRVKNAIRSGKYDVIKVDWLIRCLDEGKVIPWEPRDVLHGSMSTTKRFQEKYDRFGDEYTKDVTTSSLKEIFSGIDNKSVAATLPSHDAKDREKTFQHFVTDIVTRYDSHGFYDLPTNLLVGYRLYFMESKEEANAVAVAELKSLIRFYGGILSETTDDITHVIVTSEAKESPSLADIFKVRQSLQKKFHVVTEQWLRATVRHGCVTEEKHYAVAGQPKL